MKKVLFIDRDGTLIKEAPPTYQLDDFSKLEFYPDMFYYLRKIAAELDYELVMITNQDGLGTDTFPEDTFWPVHNLVMKSLENEQIFFSEVLIDKTFPEQHAPTRKPATGLLTAYFDKEKYDLTGSFVIGDRITDMQLAKNLSCKGFWLNNDPQLGAMEINNSFEELKKGTIVLDTPDWKNIYEYLKLPPRQITQERNTNETKITVTLNLDGTGISSVHTGISFFDHMLDQLAKHGQLDLSITCRGDLHIDEHHTIEDTGIALGEAFAKALGHKKGINRYGFLLPMDDCLAQVAIDFGGRNWIVWDAGFKREKIGEMPTEMFFHFFKSFSDAAKCNLNIKAEGENEHHKIEAIFKAFAKAIRSAVKRDINNNSLPSTKGIL
ncbi:bifunctional histidinol-phosphatase/imidazoleglycerol-phosphate dehydratase HisB [Ferruginibacter sp. HRS2-29]|uniref:bifunctional histidinol-phosphatase/imidazoleglycerol-phosphate dehydratase HisB n=1 Tax=Ferruginibacter sp. HRS2-29 TaxID=2487334 RepID=UPI0020CB735C|nr:bifunctional histidinol-phosphatase/imidazoleglycerol-phosphate dehydratase HisB [Ferruginibacter sp. HRS2-29]MCP9749871.1 bifunctional histidinol-phosphatase/imidazoleglycerol-phosphate dehydratase HisB [Ferruginibacter sp. HRS2-29]